MISELGLPSPVSNNTSVDQPQRAQDEVLTQGADRDVLSSRLEEQLKAFFERQEAFNQRLAAQANKVVGSERTAKSKRLSKHLTVSNINIHHQDEDVL